MVKKKRRYKMFGFDDTLLFAALNDAKEDKERQERRDWCRQEREQLEWEMRNADRYHYDKIDLEWRKNYLEEKEKELE